MTTDQTLTKVFSLLDRVQADPARGFACEAELARAVAELETMEVAVPASLHDLCARLRAERRAFEAQEDAFDNMPV
ncbi:MULTISPECIES: hypothetical protein [Dinoroseobacter]|nr:MULTISPECIES: hypothetical protein [Dinoroseobacter]MDD9715754.1 hypothetical protein [Dinoroseobacter sp. PD6]URF48079.1 hypothetical protein M8008_07285 [Dinoroseobacter shibae]URF52389.1 hypothetical protein M8007_07285 [Dinoroseobacter shibae]